MTASLPPFSVCAALGSDAIDALISKSPVSVFVCAVILMALAYLYKLYKECKELLTALRILVQRLWQALKWIGSALLSPFRKPWRAAVDNAVLTEFLRRCIHARVSTTASLLLGIRILFLASVVSRVWSTRLSDGGHPPPIASGENGLILWPEAMFEIFWITTAGYFVFSIVAYICTLHLAEKIDRSRKRVDTSVAPKPKPYEAKPETNFFFWTAAADVLFISSAYCVYLPAEKSELHLAYIIPFAASWLFRLGWQVVAIWGLVSLGLIFRNWMVVFGWSSEGRGLTQMDHFWSLFVLNTLPRVGFWFLVALLSYCFLAVSRDLRRVTNLLKLLRQGLPHKVFIKQHQRRFLFANDRFVGDLQLIENNQGLTGEQYPRPEEQSIIMKRDEGLNIDEEVQKKYKQIDEDILSGGRPDFRGMEQNYLQGHDQIRGEFPMIYTVKQPLIDEEGCIVGLLGICEEPSTQHERGLYQTLARQSDHFVFVKDLKGNFLFGNPRFLEAVSPPDKPILLPSQLVGKNDDHFYGTEVGEAFRKSDQKVIDAALAVNKPGRDYVDEEVTWEEMHRFPRTGKESKVRVTKRAIRDQVGKVIAIQGSFYRVEDFYRQAWVEQMLGRVLPDFERLVDQTLAKFKPVVNRQQTNPNPSEGGLELRFLRLYINGVHLGARVMNLREDQIANFRGACDKDASLKRLCWEPSDRVDAFTTPLLEIMRHRHRDVRFTVSKNLTMEHQIDTRWTSVIAGVYLQNAAEAVERMLEFAEEHKIQPEDDWKVVHLTLSSDGSALRLEVTDAAESWRKKLPGQEENPNPPLDAQPLDKYRGKLRPDGMPGIGIELVSRLAIILGSPRQPVFHEVSRKEGLKFDFTFPASAGDGHA